ALAIPYDDIESTDLPLVVRIGQGAISTLARGENEAITLIEGDDLLAPSYDPAGWVWSGAKENDGTLMVTRPGSEVLSVVSAPAPANHEVRSIRVSHAGARLAMIQELGDEVSIQVAMVIRDEDGTPTAITEPATIGNSVQDSTDLAWVDSVTLAVLGSSDGQAPTVHTVPLGGPPVALLSVPGAESLTSGRGERELWVATDDGQLFNRAGNGWRRVGEDEDVRAVAFPG